MNDYITNFDSIQHSKKFFPIRMKLLLILIICVVSLVSLTTIIIGHRIKKSNTDNFNATSSRELSHIGNGISIFFNDTLNMLKMLSQHPTVRNSDQSLHNYISDKTNIKVRNTIKSDNEKQLVTLFKQVFTAYPEFVEVYLGTKWGGYATSFDGEMSAGYDPRKRGWYQLALSAQGSPIITKAFLSTVGDVVVGLSRSVYSPRDEFIGNVSIELTLNTLTEMISKSKIGSTGYVMMIQDDGIILADPKHSDFNFKKMNEVGNEDFAKLMGQDSGIMKIKMDGEKWVAKILTIDNPNWKLIAFLQENEVYSEYYYILISMIIIGVILLILFILATSVFAMRMLKPIDGILKALENISIGNLTVRLPIQGNDEFTMLSRHFNHAIEKMQLLVQSITTNTEAMQTVGTTLATDMTKTADSIDQINLSLDKVKKQTINQSSSVTQTITIIEEIIQAITQLNTSIELQVKTISESSSATEKMINNIVSISEILEQNKSLMYTLHEKASNGKMVARNANVVVSQIAEKSSQLLETSNVIQNIASKTNLLAMNAAIEAAHVGESGKGFAVVAGEIRKLAQDSNYQGQRIASVINEALETIKNLTTAGSGAEQSFNEVYDMVSETMQKEESLANAMKEQSNNSENIRTLIKDIDNITDEVKNNSKEMLNGSETVAKEMSILDNLSQVLNNSMNEMSISIIQVNDVIQKVNNVTQKNKVSIDNLSLEINKFNI